MRKISFGIAALYLLLNANSASAIDIVLSKNNLRLNNQANSLAFTVSLSDDLSGLTGTGFIPAKLKIKSKDLSNNLSKNTILIPYNNGVIGTSSEVTLSLNSTVNASSEVPFSISIPGKYRKKYKVENFSDSINLDAQPINISGKVTIPTGDLASFKARTLKKLKAKTISPFNTENPEGVIVELVEINPSTGEAVGEPIATALTDAEGNYQMEMPSGAEFGPDYALVVEGDNNESMHAPLFSDSVPVNPATEAVFELTQEAILNPDAVGLSSGDNIDFENFTDLEFEGLNNKMEDLNPIYEETLSDSIQSLKDSYATFLNNMIGVAADDDSLATSELGAAAKGVAGDYNVAFFDSGISSENNLHISVELAAARMSKPDEVGALTVSPYPSFSTQASLFESRQNEHNNPGPGCEGSDCQFGPQNPGQPEGSAPTQRVSEESDACYELEAFAEAQRQIVGTDESGNFYMTIDPERLISFAEPASEQVFVESNGISTYRTKPGVMHMIPVGDDMFLSASINRGERISSRDGLTMEPVFDYDAGFGSIIKKSPLSASDLLGSYGIVGLGYGLGESSFSAISFLGSLDFAADSVNFNVASSYKESQATSCGGDSYLLSSGVEQLSGTASLEFQNDRVSILVDADDQGTETLFTGFARPDAEILTLVYASDSGARGSRAGHDGQSRNVISDAQRQMIFGVRKPKAQLNLTGKSYRILSANYSFNVSGGRTIESGDLGTLSFAADTASVTDLSREVFSKANVSSAVDTSTLLINQAATPYTLSADGAITVTVGSDTWTGYVSSDMSLIIFKVEQESGLGVYLAVLAE